METHFVLVKRIEKNISVWYSSTDPEESLLELEEIDIFQFANFMNLRVVVRLFIGRDPGTAIYFLFFGTISY